MPLLPDTEDDPRVNGLIREGGAFMRKKKPAEAEAVFTSFVAAWRGADVRRHPAPRRSADPPRLHFQGEGGQGPRRGLLI